MDATARVKLLIAELEGFVAEEPTALAEENWAYLKELLAKKEGHLKAIEKLANTVDWEKDELKVRLSKIKAAEDALAGLLAEKMAATKKDLSLAREGLTKIKKIKTYSTTNPPIPIVKRKNGFNASA